MKNLPDLIGGVLIVATTFAFAMIGNDKPATQTVVYEPQAEKPDDLADLKATIADHEARIANLEKSCIDGKPKAEEGPKFKSEPRKKLGRRERVKCIVYTTDGCLPCDQLKAEIEKELCGQLGWKAGESDENDIIYRKSESWQTYPTIEFRVDDSPRHRIFGKMPAADISNRLKNLIDTLDTEA